VFKDRRNKNVCPLRLITLPYSFPERALYSTNGQLIAGVAAIPGKISIAATEFYFDADKDHSDYKKLDQEVG
jgi:hypothetical protein